VQAARLPPLSRSSKSPAPAHKIKSFLPHMPFAPMKHEPYVEELALCSGPWRATDRAAHKRSPNFCNLQIISPAAGGSSTPRDKVILHLSNSIGGPDLKCLVMQTCPEQLRADTSHSGPASRAWPARVTFSAPHMHPTHSIPHPATPQNPTTAQRATHH